MSLEFRVKRSRWSRLSQLVATIVAVTMLPWYAIPVRQVQAAPVPIPTLTTPGFQTTDLDPHFQAAAASNSQEGWESIVASAKTTLSAQWEAAVDAQINAQVAAVNETDAFNSVQEYRDFLNQALQMQRQQALSGWALAADARIELERAGFIERLAARQRQATEENNRDNLNAANVAEDSSEVDSARTEWQQQFEQDMQSGLTDYQNALSGLYNDYNSVIADLQQKDQQFASDRARIQQYEQVVRTAIDNSVTQLETLLQNSGLFYAETCDGQNVCTVDTNTLNADGQTLQTLVTNLRTGLSTNQPLSTLAQQMVTYLQQQELAARNRETFWQARVRGTANYSSAVNLSGYVTNWGLQTWVHSYSTPLLPWEWVWGVGPMTGITSSAYNLGALAARDDIGGVMDFQGSGDLTKLRSFFSSTGEYRTVETVGNAIFGNATAGVFSHQPGKPASWTPLYNALLRITQIDDIGSTSCPIPQWKPGCEYRWTMAPNPIATLVASYNWYDSNADANMATWGGYANSLGPMANAWANDILPAIQTWEQQVADFDAAYTTFQTNSATLVTQAQQELAAGQNDLFQSRARWLEQMQGLYNKGLVRFNSLEKDATAAEIALAVRSADTVTGPSVDQIVDDRRLRAINAQLREIAAAPTPTVDTRNLDKIYKAIPKTFQGLANLAIATNLDTQAVDAQNDVLQTAATLIQGQGAAIEEHKFTAEITADGRVVGRRQIHTGEAIQRADTDGTSEEHYDAVFQEQAVHFEGTSAVRLAKTGDLFDSWNYGEIFDEFSENQSAFQEEATLRLKNLEGNLGYANDVAQERAKHFQSNLDQQIEAAQFTKSIIESAAMAMLGGASLSQALSSAVQGELRGQIAGQIAEATGLPAGFISALLGGSKPHKAAMSWLEGEMWGAFETEMSRVTGLPLKGVLSALWNKREAKKKAAKAKKAAVVEAVVTVAAVVAAPFTGGASVAVLAAAKAAQGAKQGGLQGALAGAAGAYVNAGAQALSGGTVSVDLSYSYENGFGAGVGFGIGPAKIGISASERGGASLSAGIGMGSGTLGLNVGYSPGNGLSAGVGYSNPATGISLGANYSAGQGLSGYAGFRPGGEGGSSPPGSGFNLNFSGDGSVSAGYSTGEGGINLGLDYDPENGFNASAGGYGIEVGYGPGGLTASADPVAIAGLAGIDTSILDQAASGFDNLPGLNGELPGIAGGVDGGFGGLDFSLDFDSENGFSAAASGYGLEVGYGPDGLTGTADLDQIAGLAGIDTSVLPGVDLQSELDLGTGQVTTTASGNIGGFELNAGYDSENGFTATASGNGINAGYGPDGLTGSADLGAIAGFAGIDTSDIAGFDVDASLDLASGEVTGGFSGNGFEGNLGPGGELDVDFTTAYHGADIDLGYNSETGFTGNLNAGGADLINYSEDEGLGSPYGNAIVEQVEGYADDPTKLLTEDPFAEDTALGQLPGVIDSVETLGEGIGEDLGDLLGVDDPENENANADTDESVNEREIDGLIVTAPAPTDSNQRPRPLVNNRGPVDNSPPLKLYTHAETQEKNGRRWFHKEIEGETVTFRNKANRITGQTYFEGVFHDGRKHQYSYLDSGILRQDLFHTDGTYATTKFWDANGNRVKLRGYRSVNGGPVNKFDRGKVAAAIEAGAFQHDGEVWRKSSDPSNVFSRTDSSGRLNTIVFNEFGVAEHKIYKDRYGRGGYDVKYWDGDYNEVKPRVTKLTAAEKGEVDRNEEIVETNQVIIQKEKDIEDLAETEWAVERAVEALGLRTVTRQSSGKHNRQTYTYYCDNASPPECYSDRSDESREDLIRDWQKTEDYQAYLREPLNPMNQDLSIWQSVEQTLRGAMDQIADFTSETAAGAAGALKALQTAITNKDIGPIYDYAKKEPEGPAFIDNLALGMIPGIDIVQAFFEITREFKDGNTLYATALVAMNAGSIIAKPLQAAYKVTKKAIKQGQTAVKRGKYKRIRRKQDADKKKQALAEERERAKRQKQEGNGVDDCGCFAGDTEVLTPAGLVAIASLKTGDTVLAVDPIGGRKIAERQITKIFKLPASGWLHVDTGEDTLVAADDHPFWVEERADWMRADQLKIGMSLRTATGRKAVVESIDTTESTTGEFKYDLTVDEDHTFFVGEDQVLVHNNTLCDWDTPEWKGRWPLQSVKLLGAKLKRGVNYVSRAGVKERNPEAYKQLLEAKKATRSGDPNKAGKAGEEFLIDFLGKGRTEPWKNTRRTTEKWLSGNPDKMKLIADLCDGNLDNCFKSLKPPYKIQNPKTRATDVLADGVIHEVKNYKDSVSLSKHVRQEIFWDILLMQTENVKPVWHFVEGAPTEPLRNMLQKYGIPIVQYN